MNKKKKTSNFRVFREEKGFLLIIIIIIMMAVIFGFVFIAQFAAIGTEMGKKGSGSSGSNDVGTGGGELANANAMTAEQVDKFLANEGSPLAGTGADVISAAKAANINPAFLLGISGAESTLGKYGRAVDNKNPGNIKSRVNDTAMKKFNVSIIGNDDEGHAIFPSWDQGWLGLAALLRVEYLDDGRDTLEKIAEIYLTGNRENWINNVKEYMDAALRTK